MRRLMCMTALVGATALAGCGDDGLGTVPVTGTVTYRGEPVEGASVMFSPNNGGRAASGLTDFEGRFALTTLNPDDGALPGNYQVGISKTVVVEGAMSAEELQAYREKYRGAPPPVVKEERLPAKYKQVATSGLTAEVTEDGENDFTFDLAD